MRWRSLVVVVAVVCGLGACRDHGGAGPYIHDDTTPDAAPPDAGNCTTKEVSEDRDGDGVAGLWRTGCGRPDVSVPSSLGDCDDTDPSRFQDAVLDADGDGWAVGSSQCFGALPPGYVLRSLGVDCDDADPTVQLQTFVDADGDGFGKGTACVAVPSNGVLPPPGFASIGGDCDDQNDQVNPAALEQWRDHLDSDCDGQDDPLQCDSGGPSGCGCELMNAPRVAIDPTCAGPDLVLVRQTTCDDCLERNVFIVGNRGTVATSGGFDLRLDGQPLHVTTELAPGSVSFPMVVHGGGMPLKIVNPASCQGAAAADTTLDFSEQCLTP